MSDEIMKKAIMLDFVKNQLHEHCKKFGFDEKRTKVNVTKNNDVLIKIYWKDTKKIKDKLYFYEKDFSFIKEGDFVKVQILPRIINSRLTLYFVHKEYKEWFN